MQVTIKLVGVFRIGRFREQLREYPAALPAQALIDELLIPQQLLGSVLINGHHAAADTLLHDGDILCLLPFIDGG